MMIERDITIHIASSFHVFNYNTIFHLYLLISLLRFVVMILLKLFAISKNY